MQDHVIRIDTLKYAELLADLPHPRWRDVLRAADRRPRGLMDTGKYEYTTPTEDRKSAARDGGQLARRLSHGDTIASLVALIHWDNVRSAEVGEDLPDLYQTVVKVTKRV